MVRFPEHLREVRLLGRGSQKEVWLVEDEQTGELAAAYRLRIANADAHDTEQIVSSLVAQRSARSACVAPIHEMIERGDEYWWVGEYFPGGDLANHLARVGDRGLPLQDVLRIGARTARALAHAHAQGLVHGDLKPSNLLIDAAGDVFLSDFGLARLAGAESHRAHGTLATMAPETFRESPVTPRSDLYALGCLLFELVDGVSPFLASDPQETIRRHLSEERPHLRARADVPLLLRRLIDRLIQSDPETRPDSARNCALSLEGMNALLPSEPAGARAPIERKGELARIDALLAQVRDGGAAAVLEVTGPSGAGKSTLLEQLRSRAERSGIVTLAARGDGAAPRPNGILATLIRPLAAWFDGLSEEEARELGRLAGTVDGEAPQELGSLSEGVHEMSLRAVAGGVRRLTEDFPLAVVVDDAQVADRDSMRVIETMGHAVARGIAGVRGLLIVTGTQRTVDTAPDPIADAPNGQRLVLDRLADEEIHDLLEARGIPAPSSHLVRAVAGQSGGHPLLADLVAARLQESGRLSNMGRHTVLNEPIGDIALPETPDAAVEQEVARLDPEIRRELERAACLGQAFPSVWLEEITGKRAQVEQRLAAAVDAGVLLRNGADHVFQHALAHRVIYDRIAPERRRTLHHEIASWAMDEAQAELPDRESFVAHHLARAGSQASPGVLADWTRRAGEQAFQRHAWGDAADLFESACRLLADEGDAPLALLGDLHRRAGESHAHREDHGLAVTNFEAAIRCFREAGDEVESIRTLHDIARAHGLGGNVEYGNLSQYVPRLEDAVRQLGGGHPQLRGQLLRTLAEIVWIAQRPQEGAAYARRALELANTCGDDLLAGETYFQIAIAKLQELRFDETLANLRSALHAGQRAGAPIVTRLALGRMPIVLYSTGRLGEAREALARAIEVNEIVQRPGDVAIADALNTLFHGLAGELEGAVRAAEPALELERRASYPWPTLVLHPSLAYARLQQRDYAGAQEAIEEMADVLEFDVGTLIRRLVALIHYYGGDPLRLEAGDLGADELPEDDAAIDLPGLLGVCLHVELANAAGMPPSPLAERALAEAEARGAVLSISWPFLVPLSRGLVALGAGRALDAMAHLDRALELAVRVASPIETARARYERARAAALLGNRLAMLGAIEDLRLAEPVLAESGLQALAERASRLHEHLRSNV